MGKKIFPETDPGCFTVVAPLATLIVVKLALLALIKRSFNAK